MMVIETIDLYFLAIVVVFVRGERQKEKEMQRSNQNEPTKKRH